MPELPDITVYLEALHQRIHRRKLRQIRLNHPFLLKTVDPPISAVEGREVVELRRLGKRLAIGFEEEYWIVIHLMLAGRLQWKPPRFKLSRGYGLAAFDFDEGALVLTEAGSRRLASLHVVRGSDALAAHNPGGLETLDAAWDDFHALLQTRCQNRPVKKVLTDPQLFSGIGNAYSDEILHRAKMSPFAVAGKLKEKESRRLFDAIRTVLTEWTDKLRLQAGDQFPAKVTAFHPDMAVHGKFGSLCPVCHAPIQRIRYGEHKETNYCPGCQTEGKLLADRVMSRLLKDDRPKHLRDLYPEEE